MASGGDSLAPEGYMDTATVGCFARTRVGKGAPVALTAMHLVTDARLTPSASLRFVSPSPLFGTVSALGSFFSGTVQGTDAAAILVDPLVLPTDHIHGIGMIRGFRSPTEADVGTVVRAYGAVSARVLVGGIVSPPGEMPDLGLDRAFLATIRSTDGDSGAAVVAWDDCVIGLLKGRFQDADALAVVVDVMTALSALHCRAP